ncbi:MAG: helix-turn-helix domain-containing protein [Phycisphaerae bacterium]|jgi:hypothetical protein
MAGMFYTLQEVIEKLGKTEAEIRTFVKEGKLREFRDGAKQLYKIEDVDAIAGSGKGATAKLDDSLQISIDETGEVSLAPEELDVLMGTEDKDKAQQTRFKLDETGELMSEETLGGTPKDKSSKSETGDEILLSPASDSTKGGASDSLSLAADSKPGLEVSNDDTKISLGGDTINVLGDSDTGYKISEDTSGETKLIQKKAKALDDKGGDEIARLDDDINLDAGGSGSGLLDLSLQADDTSLGAVLDDIYPESPAGAPSGQTPAAGVEAVAEAEQMLEPQQVQVGEPAATAEDAMLQSATMPYAAVAMVAESPADTASNIFGAILFVPLIVLIYAAIVVISGYKSISDMGILSAITPIIWYVAIGASAIVVLAALMASFSGGPKKPKAPKAPKEPKVKKVKPPKEKKAKKGQQPPAAGA